MRKKIYILLGLLVCSSFVALKAQHLYVLEMNGVQSDYVIGDLGKLHFSSGDLLVEMQNGISDTYSLNDIRYLGFTTSMDISSPSLSPGPEIDLYPNPVSDKMNVCINTSFKTAKLEIISIEGRLVYEERLFSQNGIQNWQVNLSLIPKGLYMCRVFSGKFMITKKFIKY